MAKNQCRLCWCCFACPRSDGLNRADDTASGPAGTLLQVLELLLEARASTSGGGGQPSDAANNAAGKSKGPAPVESAVLRLLWLADPVKSRCPPIRHAMLQVLQVANTGNRSYPLAPTSMNRSLSGYNAAIVDLPLSSQHETNQSQRTRGFHGRGP